MSGRIDAPWLTDPATTAVMAALQAAGGADCARFVGGAVRNTLMGKPVDDIDIATVLLPEQVIAALRKAGLKAVPTGVDHGTVTAISAGRPFEITTLRRDVETDGRRAVVAFTTDWGEDAQRRDFRLNALYADAKGQVFDPTGGGIEDAKAGRIVFVGDAETRIREDHLRILRFFRFYAWYGRGEPDAQGLAACAALKDSLAAISAERIAKELLKLLAAPDPRPAVRLMDEAGVLAAILPNGRGPALFEALVEDIDADPVLRLAALGPADAAGAADMAKALRLSNAQAARLTAALISASFASDVQVRRAIYSDGAQAVADRARLARAAGQGGDWDTVLTLARDWPPPRLPVAGRDLLAAGAAPGPAMGETLKALEAWWIDQDFKPDRQALLARVRG